MTSCSNSCALAVIQPGRGRRTRYGLRRDIAGIGSSWPVFAIDARGAPAKTGQLTALHADQYAFEACDHSDSRLADGLPYFLQDLRPRGFIGRAIPQRHPDPAVPPRIADWNDDHVLAFLVRRGEDLIGDLLLGGESLSRYLRARDSSGLPIAAADRPAQYERLAQAALAGDVPGSSASSRRFRSGRNRRSALRTLNASGALADGFLGERFGWLRAAQDLSTKKVIGAHALQAIREAAAFGRVIGNTDMHEGNLSFLFAGSSRDGRPRQPGLYGNCEA